MAKKNGNGGNGRRESGSTVPERAEFGGRVLEVGAGFIHTCPACKNRPRARARCKVCNKAGQWAVIAAEDPSPARPANGGPETPIVPDYVRRERFLESLAVRPRF